jgi:hypothetical protein
MAGAAQHFLPATYLAGFSLDTTIPRRKRKLTQGDKLTGNCHTATVERLAVINDLYTLREQYQAPPSAIDDSWASYEARLAPCISALITGTIDATNWAGVLVPFVASLFARGPDFDIRLDKRAEKFGDQSPKSKLSVDSTTLSRAMEIQRLLAPVLAARWIVCRSPETTAFITTDLAFGPFQDPDGEIGVAIPLDRQHLLQLRPRRSGAIAVAGGRKWYPMIEHRTLASGNYRQQAQALTSMARRFVFGRSIEEMQSYLRNAKPNCPLIELGDVGFLCGPLAAVHEFAWHRFVSAVASHPQSREPYEFKIDWKTVARTWKPPAIFFPTNLPEFPSPFAKLVNQIFVNLYDVEDFPSHARDFARIHMLNAPEIKH